MKKERIFTLFLVFSCTLFLVLLLNDKLSVIVAALGTYLMVLLKLVTLGTLGKTGCFHLPICKTRIRFRF